MASHKIIAKLFKALLIIGVVLVLLQGVLVYTGITFTSTKARSVLVEYIETLTQREAVIDGDVGITVSLLPELLVERILVKNTEGFNKDDLITVSEVRVQISLVSLLTGNLHLQELSAAHANIGLIHKKDGSNNWNFDHLLPAPESVSEQGKKTVTKTDESSRLSIGVFKLTDISIEYKDESYDQSINNHIERIILDFQDDEKPDAEITGSLQGYNYDISFEFDSLNKLASGLLWELDGTGTIADRKTRIDAAMQLHKHVIEGSLDVNIKDINLGLLLEHIGIITGEDAACREMNIKASLKGEDLVDVVKKAKLELQLQRGQWKWQALLKDEIRELTFDKASIRTSWNKPVKLHLDGKLFQEVIKLDLDTNHMSEFFDDMDKLDVDLTAHVAGSDIVLKGKLDLPIKTKRLQLDISLKGKDLEKLNRILNSELPSFNNYSLNGKISTNDKGFIVRADDATVGQTHFRTALIIDTSSFKPFWTINLTSRQLQIKDFEFVESKIEKPDVTKMKSAMKKTTVESKQEPGLYLKQLVDNPKMHLDLNLKIEKVLAGESVLGASSLKLKLRENTLIMDQAEFNVPGGKIKSSASFKVEDRQVKGVFKLDIDKFEYGAVARYFNPESSQGGVISARIDLKLGGRDFSRLFDQATGKMDVALWPRNTTTRIFDIWASNLFLLILPEIKKKESKVNCLVALLDMDDGIMKEDLFLMDTTKVWMHGNINVNFVEENLQLSLYPRSKTAKLFAVQAPIRAEGSFTDIKLVTNPVDIAVAYASFITSPLHVPARWVFGDKVPEDASAQCEKFFDREYAIKLKEKLEAEEQKEIDEWLDSD